MMWRWVVLTGLLVLPCVAFAEGPSFNCKKAKHADELAICGNEVLSRDDLETTKLFELMKATDRTGAIAIAKAFLKARRACGRNAQCIGTAQTAVIVTFNQAMNYPLSPNRQPVIATQPKPAQIANGWFPGERLDISQGYGDPIVSRKGFTPSGFAYSIYQDGSAALETPTRTWSITCKSDAMTDARQCSLYSTDDPSFMIFYASSTIPQSVCIVGHDFPGRNGGIRIDKNDAHTTDQQGCVDASIIQELTAGTTITTRAFKWPYDYPVDRTGSLQGLPIAMALVNFIQQNLGKLSFQR